MEKIQSSLGCGNVYQNRTWLDLEVTKFDDIDKKIIPLFEKFPIRGVKALDFKDWCKVAEIVKTKNHLTIQGLDEILKIKSRMNTGR